MTRPSRLRTFGRYRRYLRRHWCAHLVEALTVGQYRKVRSFLWRCW